MMSAPKDESTLLPDVEPTRYDESKVEPHEPPEGFEPSHAEATHAPPRVVYTGTPCLRCRSSKQEVDGWCARCGYPSEPSKLDELHTQGRWLLCLDCGVKNSFSQVFCAACEKRLIDERTFNDGKKL